MDRPLLLASLLRVEEVETTEKPPKQRVGAFADASLRARSKTSRHSPRR